MNRKNIVHIKYYHRETICKLSSTLKEPQGSHAVAVKGQFAWAVFYFLMSEGSHCHRFVGTIIFYF